MMKKWTSMCYSLSVTQATLVISHNTPTSYGIRNAGFEYGSALCYRGNKLICKQCFLLLTIFITNLRQANRQYTTLTLDIFSLPLCCNYIRATTQILLNALFWIASIGLQSEKFFGKGACHAANGY